MNGGIAMSAATEILDMRELTPTKAIFQITNKLISMKRGEILEVIVKHDNLKRDLDQICKKLQKQLSVESGGHDNFIKCLIYI
jgi:TusA-related sulfurtransferase